MRRYDDIGRILTGDHDATAEAGVAWVHELCEALKIPPLASYGIGGVDVPVLIEKATAASSMKGNPIDLTPDEMREIIGNAM